MRHATSNYSTQALSQALELWRDHDKYLIRGSFIRVTESKLLQWARANQLRFLYSKNKLAAVAVLSAAAARQPVKDFSGSARFCIESGDITIRRLACRPGYEDTVVQFVLNQQRPYPRIWLRIWQEHPVDRKIVDLISAKWMGTKILSGGELVGIWCFGNAPQPQPLPAHEYWALRRMALSHLPVVAAKIAILRKSADLISHYSAKYNSRSSWSALALRGYGGKTDFIIKPSEMPKTWKRQNRAKLEWEISDTPLRSELPELEALIDAIPGTKQRIRIMRLGAGGKIKRHSDAIDKDAGTAPGKTLRIHIPICTNSRVWFTAWNLDGGKTGAHMGAGEAWFLDTRKPHEVENYGNSDRIHLVMDVVSSPEILNLASAANDCDKDSTRID